MSSFVSARAIVDSASVSGDELSWIETENSLIVCFFSL